MKTNNDLINSTMKTTVKTIIFLFIFTLSFIGKAQNEGEKGAQYRVDEEDREATPKTEQSSIVPEQSSVDPLEYLKMKNVLV